MLSVKPDLNAERLSLFGWVESDELTYNLHIMVRYEIEKAIMEDKIKVEDLPKIWNAKMREITGKSPGDEGEGVLQDVHWSSGYFGYFPTYAIGTIYSAQLYNALKKKYKNIEEDLKKGDYKRIINWLRENIHGKGSVSLAEDIIMQCCGEGLNSDSYVRYLTNKYGEIYKFK